MLGIVALAVAAFVAAFAISTYEAWWTVALVPLGAIVLGVQRSSLRGRSAVLVGGGLVAATLLGAAGGWMVVLGSFGGARPCDACFDNRILLVPGLAVLVVAIGLAAICVRSIVHAFRQAGGNQ